MTSQLSKNKSKTVRATQTDIDSSWKLIDEKFVSLSQNYIIQVFRILLLNRMAMICCVYYWLL